LLSASPGDTWKSSYFTTYKGTSKRFSDPIKTKNQRIN
jgi:hypothetical protein